MDILKIYGSKTFNEKEMQRRLPKETYESIKKTIQQGLPLDMNLATIVAQAMKEWALEQGATHYAHWFQPMTNITAGKHDSFIEVKRDGSIALEFSPKALTRGESDASSFPSGGLRETFEARGYTAWDPTSPAYVVDNTLFIPTAFCSYTGEALDIKTPLLKSQEALSKYGVRFLRAMGNTNSKNLKACVGAEQEYFLVDRELAEQRLDLKICGRTLIGSKPPKGQELDDHYCGRLKIRVTKFMQELDEQLWSLGVASKTKHNEAAPAQHELAPIFTDANVACDQNQLIMNTMKKVAKENGLTCLLHEKPFAGVNGSGKHNNYSLTTDDGINLLKSGSNPANNDMFIMTLCAFIRGVDKYASLLRMSASCPGNEYRLGALEAPPGIVSIYLGLPLTKALMTYSNADHEGAKNQFLEMGVQTLPSLRKDEEDRNRTSPFAFTGNKFEFRMVGSSQSITYSNIVLNTALADSFAYFSERLESAEDKSQEMKNIVDEVLSKHGKIIFNGNNYSDEWVEEAKRRGLPIINSCIDGYKAFIEPKNIELFEKYNVFSSKECFARYEINVESYVKIIGIEASTMLEMTKRQVLPSCIEYAGRVAESYNKIVASGIKPNGIKSHLDKVTSLIEDVIVSSEKLGTSLSYSQKMGDFVEQAEFMYREIRENMSMLRYYCDTLEAIVDKKNWPMPTYTDLLFRV